MEVEPPSALTRFGMIFLAVSLAAIGGIWGVLKWLEKPAITPLKATETAGRGVSPTRP